jgi:hypothetical protein
MERSRALLRTFERRMANRDAYSGPGGDDVIVDGTAKWTNGVCEDWLQVQRVLDIKYVRRRPPAYRPMGGLG